MAEQLSPKVTIEPCLESAVYEYTLDGEKIKSTQSMSDHFTKILSRMELNDLRSDDTTENGVDEEKRAGNTKNTFAPFIEHMRQAHIEVCGLYDVLSLVMTNRYFNLLPNAPDYEEQTRQSRELVFRQQQEILQKSWISKQTSARHAAKVLLSSYERFMKIINRSDESSENFHVQLSNLRQRWKIRKQQNTNRYVGDLSFRSAGSFYPYKMQFEVTKADTQKRTQHNAIEVIIPEDLQVRMILKVDIETKDGQLLLRTYSTMLANDNPSPLQENSYNTLLENAQRTVFLKELFAQLCREASEITNIIQPTVLRNSIRCWILSDVMMTISLLRSNEFDPSMETDGMLYGSHVGLLEYALCALLRQQYLRNFHYSPLKPSTLMLGVPALRRVSGVNAFNFNQLRSITENKSILQNIIDITQHQIIRSRVLELLNHLANNCDINMTVNVSTFSSMKSTYGRVYLVAPGYDGLYRASYMFQIEDSQVHIQHKSNLVEFQHHVDEIQRFFISQIANFKFTVACNIAKIFGWHIVGSTTAPAVGRLTEIQFSAQLDHPHLSPSIGIRIGDDLQLQVAIHRRRSTNTNQEKLMESDFSDRSSIGIRYDPISLDDFCGANVLQKFEMFIATVTHQEKHQ